MLNVKIVLPLVSVFPRATDGLNIALIFIAIDPISRVFLHSSKLYTKFTIKNRINSACLYNERAICNMWT